MIDKRIKAAIKDVAAGHAQRVAYPGLGRVFWRDGVLVAEISKYAIYEGPK